MALANGNKISNKISLNLSKTKLIVFRPERNFTTLDLKIKGVISRQFQIPGLKNDKMLS